MKRMALVVMRRRGVMGGMGIELGEVGMEMEMMGGGTLVRMRKRSSGHRERGRESPTRRGTTRRRQRTTWAGVRAVIG
jgi:hypothetical protein